MDDTLPKKIYKNELGIVNLDSNAGPGTHWVAYKKINENIYYFDSFGNVNPEKKLIKYFKSSGEVHIYYNTERHQKYSQTICGKLCLKFLSNK